MQGLRVSCLRVSTPGGSRVAPPYWEGLTDSDHEDTDYRPRSSADDFRLWRWFGYGGTNDNAACSYNHHGS